MMVSKLNAAGNKVENVLRVPKAAMIDRATGSVTKDSCNTYCQKFGSATYVPVLPSTKNEPWAGANYDSGADVYSLDQPFPSWVWNADKARWECPYAFDEQVQNAAGYKGFRWLEGTRKWRALKPDVNQNSWEYNEISGTWDDTGNAWRGADEK